LSRDSAAVEVTAGIIFEHGEPRHDNYKPQQEWSPISIVKYTNQY
jgi:hypothetical protein